MEKLKNIKEIKGTIFKDKEVYLDFLEKKRIKA